MKRKFFTIPLVMAAVLVMAGCGNVIPDMTADEMQAIGEYAAITLLKYDVNHRSRLVDLELVAQAEAKARAEAEAQAAAEAKEQEEAGTRPTDNTPIVGGVGTVTAPTITMEEIFNLPEGVSITYRETKICESYPEGGQDFFSVPATSGHQLFVLKFDLYNGSDQDQYIDLLSQFSQEGLSLKVTVNGTYSRRSLTTMLLNDVTSYMDTLAAGARVEVVAVVEVENSIANNVSSIKLELKNESNTYTDQLL